MNSNKIIIISTWLNIFRNIRNNTELVKQLLILSLTQQYKKAILGSAWLILSPLFTIAVWIILNSSGIYKPGETAIPYAAFVLLSVTIWNFFISFFRTIGKSVSESGKMLMECAFPIEVAVFERILLSIINFTIPLVLNFIVLIIFDVSFGISSFLFIPSIIPLMLLGISIGMFISLFEVVFNDIFLVLMQGINILMYLSPVVYSPKVESAFLQTIIKYNPLTYLISVPRDYLIGSTPEVSMTGFWYATIATVVIFIFVVEFYLSSVNKIIEKIFE